MNSFVAFIPYFRREPCLWSGRFRPNGNGTHITSRQGIPHIMFFRFQSCLIKCNYICFHGFGEHKSNWSYFFSMVKKIIVY